MKKTYIIPHSVVRLIEVEQIISVSEIYSEKGIDYGGVDDSGNLDPETKTNFFDFDWD